MGKVQLILIHCTIDISLMRNREQNTIVRESTLKAILTKAKNIFGEYRDVMNGIEIDTSNFTISDFKNYSLSNYREYLKEDDTQLTLF